MSESSYYNRIRGMTTSELQEERNRILEFQLSACYETAGQDIQDVISSRHVMLARLLNDRKSKTAPTEDEEDDNP